MIDGFEYEKTIKKVSEAYRRIFGDSPYYKREFIMKLATDIYIKMMELEHNKEDQNNG